MPFVVEVVEPPPEGGGCSWLVVVGWLELVK